PSALKHPIRRTTLLNQRSNRTTSISHHRTNLRIRLQQRRHIRNKPIHTLTSLIKFHMPQTITTLPSKRNRRPLHIRRNLNTEREPINSNRKLIPSIKPQLRRNHRRRSARGPHPQTLTRKLLIIHRSTVILNRLTINPNTTRRIRLHPRLNRIKIIASLGSPLNPTVPRLLRQTRRPHPIRSSRHITRRRRRPKQ